MNYLLSFHTCTSRSQKQNFVKSFQETQSHHLFISHRALVREQSIVYLTKPQVMDINNTAVNIVRTHPSSWLLRALLPQRPLSWEGWRLEPCLTMGWLLASSQAACTGDGTSGGRSSPQPTGLRREQPLPPLVHPGPPGDAPVRAGLHHADRGQG